MARAKPTSDELAEAVLQLYPEVYQRLHARRDKGRGLLTAASSGLLQHLVAAGPLTVTELARHVGRAQSVVSETIDQLVGKDLLARAPDDRDRRRTLVWLTDLGHAALAREREVLSRDLVRRAMARLPLTQAEALTTGLRALVRAADDLFTPGPAPIPPQRRRRKS